MTEYMIKEEYDSFIALKEKFRQCLIFCAQEISQIANGRLLVGEFDGDADLYDDDKYLVRFETHSRCGTDSDSVYVPIRYLYEGVYREYYRKHLILQNEMRERARLHRKKAKKTYRLVPEDEFKEYERLKAKFGDSGYSEGRGVI